MEAWQFTQRFAGIALGALGLILSGIMLFISSGFAGMDAMDMVWKAFWCLVWQGVLAFLVNAVIWIVTAIRYDGKGCLRAARRR